MTAHRVSERELKQLIKVLANEFGLAVASDENNGKGLYLDMAYGSYKVFDGAAGSDMLDTGYVSKRELLMAIHAAIGAAYHRRLAGTPRHSTNPRHRSPGKFEGASDDRLAAALYDVVMMSGHDEEAGDVQEHGIWYGLIVGRRPGKPSYIVWEDSQGFFDYSEFDTEAEAREEWAAVEKDIEDRATDDDDEFLRGDVP